MKALHFLRHPRVINPARLAYGMLDLPTDLRRVMESDQGIFEGMGCHIIFSSPLKRAQSLAQEVSRRWQIPLEIDDRLREISLGTWEGRPFEDIAVKDRDLYNARGLQPWTVKAPQGESFAEVGNRAMDFYRAVQQDKGLRERSVLIVGHAGWLRALAVMLGGLKKEDIFSTQVPYGAYLSLPPEEKMAHQWTWWFQSP